MDCIGPGAEQDVRRDTGPPDDHTGPGAAKRLDRISLKASKDLRPAGIPVPICRRRVTRRFGTHLIESFWKLSKGRNVHGADEEHDNLIYSRLSMTRRSPD